MNLNEYQEKAFKYAKTNNPLERLFGLGEEIGEIMALFKRRYRGDGSTANHELFRAKLVKELGDGFWYLSGVAKDNGITLEEVATTNLEKLEDRDNRGVIKGEGDNR